MVNEQTGDESNFLNDIYLRIRNLDEKNNMLKDRLLLMGQNLIDLKEKTNNDILEIKKSIIILKTSMDKILSFIETASSEFSKFAKKEDVEILLKQAKMFQPLEFVRKKDLKKY